MTTLSAPWRRLPFSDEPLGRQLARGEAVLGQLGATGAPALRWYVPAEPALVLGNGQKPGMTDLDACRAAGIRVYRRTSGGSAVLVNGHLLSLDVALPADHPLATTDVVRAYQWIGELWTAALHALGAAKARAIPTEEVRAIPALAKDDPLRLACFGTLSPWEVVIGKRKLVGLCQVRRRPGVLYQTGLHLRFDPKALGALLDLNNTTRKTLGTRLHNAVVALDEAAGHPIAADDVIAAVEQSLTDTLGAILTPADYTAAERADADRLQRERFLPF
jgi:lipoate-protein ligase A